ncbi:MAG: LCP family protein [Lachnospiraceae bacterium]|nr:LCP family protein [Erysipelotrichaceae bacterium]MBR4342412.1 LCP family protein [Lachnospiraceae bacterium]
MKEEKKNNKTIHIISSIIAAITLLASFCLYIACKNLGILPENYLKYILYGLVVINVLFGFIGLYSKVSNFNKILQIIICGLLSVCMIFVSIVIPDYKGRIEQAFTPVPETTTLYMNVYVLKDSPYEKIRDLINKNMGIQSVVDLDHQKVALEDINNRVKKRGEINYVEYDNIYSSTEALYNGECDAILLTNVYADIVADNTDYEDFYEKTRILYTVTQEIVEEHIQKAIPTITNTPFVVAIAGNDSYDYSLLNNNRGRTDVNIVAIVNPLVKKILLVTITRDAYLPIDGDINKMDRLTNASILGIDAWERAIEYALGMDINYFVRVNFASLINIVDAIGGIDINNPVAFTRIYYFDQGLIHLDGEMALSYVRERKSLHMGDFDRNRNQARVLNAIINKVLSPAIINNFDNLLNAVKGTFVTDFKTEDMYKLVQMQLQDNAKWQFETYSVYGSETFEHSYTLGGGQGSAMMLVAHLDKNRVKTAKQKIFALLDEDGE